MQSQYAVIRPLAEGKVWGFHPHTPFFEVVGSTPPVDIRLQPVGG
ncbi:hypothetical protein [Nocardia yamanashiensis]|nr:hypothetical protein [Nocardia yamanashiensis]